MPRIRITLEAEMTREEFQEALGADKQGGNSPFDIYDAIVWEMDYGDEERPSHHNGIAIKCDIKEK